MQVADPSAASAALTTGGCPVSRAAQPAAWALVAACTCLNPFHRNRLGFLMGKRSFKNRTAGASSSRAPQNATSATWRHAAQEDSMLCMEAKLRRPGDGQTRFWPMPCCVHKDRCVACRSLKLDPHWRKSRRSSHAWPTWRLQVAMAGHRGSSDTLPQRIKGGWCCRGRNASSCRQQELLTRADAGNGC